MEGNLAAEGEKSTYSYNGDAVDLDSGKKLYTDNHEEYYSGDTHQYSIIKYKDPSGKVFAEKKIYFTKKATLPDFKLIDSRDGYEEGAELSGNKITLNFKKNKNSKLTTKQITLPANPVIDGGFDYYVRENWDELKAGKTKVFNFFSPSQLDYFKFVVRKIKETPHLGREALHLKMEVDNLLLKAFVRPISMIYDAETKRILHYEGMSNINNEQGKSYNVRITYAYK